MAKADDFWREFEQAAPQLWEQVNADDTRQAFETIDAMLERHGFDFCFDITARDGELGLVGVLIFSPEGDPTVASQIDEFLDAALPLAEWRILGRRERKDFDFVSAITSELYEVEIEGVQFVVDDAFDAGPRVTIHLPAAESLSESEKRNLGQTLLWHLLGESLVIRQRLVSRVVSSPPPADGRALSVDELLERFPAE